VELNDVAIVRVDIAVAAVQLLKKLALTAS
jgi:hypothetical protein